MQVKFLKPTSAEPISVVPHSEYGKLLKRPTKVKRESDGVLLDGPMEHYWAKGRTPDLPEDIAKRYIDNGDAEQHDAARVMPLEQSDYDDHRRTIQGQVIQ